MNSIALEPIYDSLPLVLAVSTLTLIVVLLVTPPTENQTQRRTLISLRLTAAIVLLLALLRPSLVRTDNRAADAVLVVAVDTSQSMTLPDGTGGDRWTAQKQAWQQLANGMIDIDENLHVRLIAYDQSARNLATQPAALDPIVPDGESTDLGAAGLTAIQSAQGQPIAALVLMGDGKQTAPQQGAGIGRVAETLNSLGVPIFTVPIGPPGGESSSRDVTIDALSESYQLFAGNQVDISFQVRARGMVGIELPISLSWIASDGTTTEVALRQIAVTGADETLPMTIPLVAPAPGTYRLRVEAKPQLGELVTTDNVQTAFVDVREGGGRILYLEGTLRYEQVLLRRSLRRFQDLDLTFRPILENTSLRWPIDLNDAFQTDKFDIYIIGDLDASALGDKQLGDLAQAVSDGAGLITLGGFQTYGAGGYAGSPLAEVIPIQMDKAQRRTLDAPTSNRADQLDGPISIVLSRRHPVTDLGGDDPIKTWQQLPSILGANRFIGPKVAPGVEVLLETNDQQPLLVVGQYGRGRTAALAFDSTWRWWRGGQSEAHRRFWRQLMLWLLAREESSESIQIEIDSRRFAANDPPEFRAWIQTISDSVQSVELVAELIDPSGNVTLIDTSTDRDGNGIRGRLPKTVPGFHRLRVRPAAESPTLQAAEKPFQSIDESREMASPMADPVYLQQLAGMTAEHGGAAFDPSEIDALIDKIKSRRTATETPVIEKLRLGDGPWSGWILFTLFAGTLSTEWFLRRRWGFA